MNNLFTPNKFPYQDLLFRQDYAIYVSLSHISPKGLMRITANRWVRYMIKALWISLIFRDQSQSESRTQLEIDIEINMDIEFNIDFRFINDSVVNCKMKLFDHINNDNDSTDMMVVGGGTTIIDDNGYLVDISLRQFFNYFYKNYIHNFIDLLCHIRTTILTFINNYMIWRNEWMIYQKTI